MQNRLFDIVTLSENNRLSSYQTLNDPITDILGGSISILTGIFPNIFGGNRKKLTDADYIQLLPGSGFWTNKFRNYVKARIHYDVDWAPNIQNHLGGFVWENRKQICPTVPDSCWNYNEVLSCTTCITAFTNILNKEMQTGGTLPVGQTPGGYGGVLDINSLIPIGIGAFLLVMLMKKKK